MSQLRVVVEHLLEVRDQPVRIGAVAGKAAAQLVANPAVGHGLERDGRHAQGFGILAATPGSQQELECHGCRELGGAAKATAPAVEGRRQTTHGGIELEVLRICAAWRKRELLAEVPRQQPCLRGDFLPARPIRVRDAGEHPRKPRQPMSVRGWEIRPAKERLQAWRQEDAHGPAAGPGHGLHRGHVDLVEVGALLAIDLDRHEVAVQLLRDGGVLEGLPLHDVAPVAG